MADLLDSLLDDTLFDELVLEGQQENSETLDDSSSLQSSAETSQSLSKSRRVPHVKHKITKDYREKCNLAIKEIREAFSRETIFSIEDLPNFTEAFNTTVTLEASIDGDILFTEETISPFLTHTHLIQGYDSNFHHSRSPDYYEPPKPPKSTRGRKKKQSNKKPRAHPGDGTNFNSQVTVVVSKGPGHPPGKPFRFKFFRQGNMQIPGATLKTIGPIYEAIKHVAEHFRGILTNYYAAMGAPRELAPFTIRGITPVMKNYRFTLSCMRPKQILRLDQLRMILLANTGITLDDIAGTSTSMSKTAKPLRIIHVKYTPEDPSKLSVVFSTPIPGKPDKGTRLNVFSSGKINILGAFEVEATNRICRYMHKIIDANYLTLVATEGVPFLGVAGDLDTHIRKLCLEGLLRLVRTRSAEIELEKSRPKPKTLISRGKTILKRVFK